MEMLPLFTLFPSLAHLHFSIGPYGERLSSEGAVPIEGLDPLAASGIEIRHDASTWSAGPSFTPAQSRLALGVDDEGLLSLDRLELHHPGFSIRSRPALGDNLELSFLGGRWIGSVGGKDFGRFQVRGLLPGHLTLLGFSDTDQPDPDEDKSMRYFISAGLGGGGEVLGKMFGPLGYIVQGKVVAESTNRRRPGERNHARREVSADTSLGLTLLRPQSAWGVSGWGELVTQWEPRDEGGKDGVDRQMLIWGVRLWGRFFDSGSSPTWGPELGEASGSVTPL